MMAKHVHAELMAQYAQDAMETDSPWERWEFNGELGEGWQNMHHNPSWGKNIKYRRKPQTININGHEVPEPVRHKLKQYAPYYAPNLSGKQMYNQYTWMDWDGDFISLERGIIHLTPEAAILHANALLSFTRRQK